MALASEMVAGGLFASTAESINGRIENGITAAGTTQATAYQLTKSISIIGTAALSSGVILPGNCGHSDVLRVKNEGANAATVYPPVGGTIDGGAANAGVSVAVAAGVTLVCVDNGLTFHTL